MTQHKVHATTNTDTDTVIIDCGILSDTKWPGGVSALKMIADGFTDLDTIRRAIKDVNKYYIDVNPGARTRCIDGRHDPELDESNLGPQVPGGAPGAALAYRLGVDKDDLTRGTFLSDAEAMIGNFVRLGLPIGGHRDENSAGKSTVGCGAIDAMNIVLARMTDPALVDDQKRVLKMLLGDEFDRDVFLRDMGAAVVVNGRTDDYFRDREKIIDVLEQTRKGSVSTLQGDHKECLVVANFVPNTTLSSNRFADDFNGIQAFGYDIWRSKEIATKILPLPSQDEDRKRFVMARVMSTVATLMALTDGSQRLLIRVPVPVEEN
jgi:hypothetical protein